MAKGFNIAPDSRSVTFELRDNATFHDGTPVTGPILVQALERILPTFLGPLFEDIKAIESAPDGKSITVGFKRPSPFLVEAFEATITKPGSPKVGTGPYVISGPDQPNEMRANPDYYLGKPTIDRIVVTSFPTIRAAWAEMLRNNIDMLYEVGPEAAASMQDSTTISTFTFVRLYQYVVILNEHSPKFRDPAVRRALNMAIDRDELVRDAFDGRALPGTGLLWPQNRVLNGRADTVASDLRKASADLSSKPKLEFTCLVPTDYERVALVVQRQLAAVGVTMKVDSTTPDRAFQAVTKPTFEAVLMDVIGGPDLLRPYLVWHSGGSASLGMVGSPALDAAWDAVRDAESNETFARAVTAVEKLSIEDPPALYLAWGQRLRAVTKRFSVPTEPGRDVLATLRLWKPDGIALEVSRN